MSACMRIQTAKDRTMRESGRFVRAASSVFRTGAIPSETAAAFWTRPLARRTLACGALRQPWVVYAKLPFGSLSDLLHCLARHTHRVAISNHRQQCAGSLPIQSYRLPESKSDW